MAMTSFILEDYRRLHFIGGQILLKWQGLSTAKGILGLFSWFEYFHF